MSDTLASVREEAGIDIRVVDTSALVPNSYNPNQMETDILSTLTEAIREEGMTQPVLVRPHPEEPGKFLIVDGEHRWRSASAVGLAKIAVVVVDYDETKAKVRTLSLNHVRGQDVPIKLARLLVDLQRTYTDGEIAAMTGIRTDDQANVLALLDVPDLDFDGPQMTTMGADNASRPVEVNLLLLPDDHAAYEEAMSRVLATAGGHITPLIGQEVTDYHAAMRETQGMLGMKMRNVALASICRVFLELPEDMKRQILATVKAKIDEKLG